MKTTPTIPSRFTTFVDAVRPCLAKLRLRLDEPAYPNMSIGDGIAWLQAGLNRLQINAAGLNKQFDQLNREIFANEHAGDADIYRGAGRFEAYLDGFLDDRDSVCRTSVAGEFIEARALLIGAYRRALLEICDWLANLLGVIEDPVAEAHRRGLPTDGPIQLNLTLTLTAAPEMGMLGAWVERQRTQGEIQSFSLPNVEMPRTELSIQRAPGERYSFWKLVGGIALGALFLDGIIDNDCGGCDPDA